MEIRGPIFVTAALLLALGASACDSSGASAGPSATTTAPRPDPARRLGPAPGTCPAPRPPQQLVNLADYGNLIGSAPVWAGLYARFDPRRGGYRIHRDAPRTGYGWRIKVLWVAEDDVGGAVRVVATAISGRSRLWFNVGARDPRPRPQATLDPANPGVPPTGDYVEFPSYVFIPRAGCYGVDVSWPGGSWRLVIGLGR